MTRHAQVSPAFAVSFRTEGGIMEARVTGVIDTPGAAVAMLTLIGGKLRESGALRLLVLDEAEGRVPTEAEFHEVMRAIQGSGLDPARVAYVDVRATAVARMEVGEVIARERGFKVKVFDLESLARAWLRYGED